MSSGYPPYGGMQGPLCQRCHVPLLPNEATCRNCGYYNAAPVQGPTTSNGSWGNFAVQPPQGQSGPPSWGQFPAQPAVPPSQMQNFNNPPSSMLPSQMQNFNNPPSAPLQMGGGNFFGAPAPSSPPPMQGNGYAPNQAAPSAYNMAPPGFAPQWSSGAPSTGPVGPQPYGMPSNGPISQLPQAPYGTPAPGFMQYGAPPVPGQSFSGTEPFNASRTPSAGLQPFPMAAGAPSSVGMPGSVQPVSNDGQVAHRLKPAMIVLLVGLVAILLGGGVAGYVLLNKNTTATTVPSKSIATSGAPKGAPLFADTFKNNANNWSLESDPGVFSMSLAGNALVLEDDKNELLWEPLPGNKTFADFTLSFDAMLSQGDQTNGYGVYVRGSSVQNAEMPIYYRFELYGDGSYAIFKGLMDTNGVPTSAKLVDYTLDPAIKKQGSFNHVTITAKGSTMSFTVNGQVLKTITDSSYTSGIIAPFVSNMQNAKPGAQAKFGNLTLYPA